jgi:dipeptidase D
MSIKPCLYKLKNSNNMSEIKNLQPTEIWKNFYALTQIPRPSKKEAEVIAYMKKFGEELGLKTIVDEVGNVIIKKPATPGMENRKGVIMQGHLDMVPQKNSDKDFDFEKDPIECLIDGEWVTANGTTLGADNGMGIAATMAVLESTSIKHGPIEALFTIDEETGMTGAFGLKSGILDGDILLNLDSEDEGEMYVGCAGGIDVNAKKSYKEDDTPPNMAAYKVTAKGLKGGHSGIDIPLGRANANKIIFRFLMQAEADFGIRMSEAGGGDLRNAIPREANVILTVPSAESKKFEDFVENYDTIYKNEFAETEPDLSFTAMATDLPAKVADASEQYKMIRAVFATPHGVERMSSSMPGLVETSNNLAVVEMRNGKFNVCCLTRSSVDTAKYATAWRIAAIYHLIDADVDLEGSYPGWKPNMDSPILKISREVYNNKYGKIPEIRAIHAGLECGLLGGVYPNLDMISFGPTIRFPHSPDEKVNIETVGKFWDFIVALLEQIPTK